MYTKIDSQAVLDRFLDDVHHFHDTVLRELALLARAYVDDELHMFGDADPYDARLVFQMQSADTPCVELVFEGVTEISFWSKMVLSPSGRYAEDGITVVLAKPFGGDFFGVKAQGAKYRVLDRSFLGQETLAVEPIPVGENQVALDLGDGWVQCPACSNVVQTTRPAKMVRCDDCGMVLEVPNSTFGML